MRETASVCGRVPIGCDGESQMYIKLLPRLPRCTSLWEPVRHVPSARHSIKTKVSSEPHRVYASMPGHLGWPRSGCIRSLSTHRAHVEPHLGLARSRTHPYQGLNPGTNRTKVLIPGPGVPVRGWITDDGGFVQCVSSSSGGGARRPGARIRGPLESGPQSLSSGLA